MTIPTFSADDFRNALLRLLPRGPIWSRAPDGIPSLLAGIWAQTFARNSDRATALLVDCFPSTAVELLPEWESSLGLPDPCAGPAATIAQRRAQVVARLSDGGGSSTQYYVDFAAALGYEITIKEFKPSRFGKKFGDPFGGTDWAYAWQVTSPSLVIVHRKFGAPFGEAFANWGATVVQCELLSRKPAHTILTFNYVSSSGLGTLGNFILGIDVLG